MCGQSMSHMIAATRMYCSSVWAHYEALQWGLSVMTSFAFHFCGAGGAPGGKGVAR